LHSSPFYYLFLDNSSIYKSVNLCFFYAWKCVNTPTNIIEPKKSPPRWWLLYKYFI